MKVVTFYLSNKIKNYMTYCPGFGQQLATTQLVCNNQMKEHITWQSLQKKKIN